MSNTISTMCSTLRHYLGLGIGQGAEVLKTQQKAVQDEAKRCLGHVASSGREVTISTAKVATACALNASGEVCKIAAGCIGSGAAVDAEHSGGSEQAEHASNGTARLLGIGAMTVVTAYISGGIALSAAKTAAAYAMVKGGSQYLSDRESPEEAPAAAYITRGVVALGMASVVSAVAIPAVQTAAVFGAVYCGWQMLVGDKPEAPAQQAASPETVAD